MRRRVGDLEAAVKTAPPRDVAPRPVPADPVAAARQAELTRLRTERESLERQIALRTTEEEQLRRQLAEYRRRVEAAPTRESELTELTRDYDTLRETYRVLLVKKEESQIATNLERRQIGEQFRVVDPARVPERPVSPNRPLILVGGLALGLALGVGLVVLIELLDRTFRTQADVMQALQLPVLALVPAVQTAAVARRARIRRRMLSAVVVVLLVVVAGGAIYWTLRS
jgi:hypothetical protein